MPVLIVKHGDDETAYELPEDRPVFIGRDPKCDIRLTRDNVSRLHAVVIHKNGMSGIKDLNSFADTFLNDKPLSQPAALAGGDTVRIASYRIRLLKLHSARPDSRMTPDADSDVSFPDKKERNTTRIVPPSVRREQADLQTQSSDMRELMRSMEARGTFGKTPEQDTPPLNDAESAPANHDRENGGGEKNTDTELLESEVVLDGHVFQNMRLPVRTADNAEETADLPEQSASAGFPDDADGAASQTEQHDATDSRSLEEMIGLDDGSREDGEVPPSIEEELDLRAPDCDSLPLEPALREAVDARLKMYSLLSNLAEERRFFRTHGGDLPEDVLNELGRQDREFYTLPPADEVERLLREKQRIMAEPPGFDDTEFSEDLLGLHHAENRDRSKKMQAEDMAVSQLLLIDKFNSQVLPVVFRRAYALAVDEPLARELRSAKIEHVALIGGACYCLALEKMLDECKTERQSLKARLKSEPEGKNDGIGGFLDKLARNLAPNKADKAEAARLHQSELALANKAIWIGREIAFVEKHLIREFWRAYHETVMRYIPNAAEMPMAVRAFIRYGIVGFKPWWLSRRLRNYVESQCRDDVTAGYDGMGNAETILYADEYLAAVWNNDIAPTPNETSAVHEKNSAAWKADRAFRRMINGRTRAAALRRILRDLAAGMIPLNEELAASNLRALESAANPDGPEGESPDSQARIRLMEEKLAAMEARTKFVEDRFLKPAADQAAEAERRFQAKELTEPAREAILAHECDQVVDSSRRLAGSRERFLPLFVRKHFALDSDAVVDRAALETFLDDAEAKDPDLFTTRLIDSARKANRLPMRLSPFFVVAPSSGAVCHCLLPRDGLENGRLFLPALFFREGLRDRRLMDLIADFRWECSLVLSGRDPMSSDSIAGSFMRIRWEWRRFPRKKREKGLIFKELSDMMNWRRVYELYMADAMAGGRRLFSRNHDCYARIFAKYFEPPEGVEFLKKKT